MDVRHTDPDMNVSSKYRLVAFAGVLLPMVGICIFTFIIGPRLIGEREAAKLGSTLGLWFAIYLVIVVAVVIAREIRARRPK